MFAAHGFGFWQETIGSTVVYWIVLLVIWAFIEAAALGLIGGYDNPFNKLAFDATPTRSSPASFLPPSSTLIGWEVILQAR